MKHISKLSLIAIFIIFLSLYKESLSVPINTYIDNVSPRMNAVSANKSTDIVIVFGQDMNPSTVNSGNIKVFGFQTGLLQTMINFNPITRTVVINPVQNFKHGEIISVTLTDRIKTMSEENISPFVYTFTVQTIGGNGIFTKISAISDFENAELKCGDIDGDNNIDLVVNNKIYKNNGNAVFSFLTQLPMSGLPELADFDSDGDLDILIENSGSIYFYQNNGTGNFTQIYVFSGYLGAYGDIDGNGFLDIAFLNSVNMETRKNNNGVFINDTLLHLSSSCGTGYNDKILINDMNNDGILDILGIIGEYGGGIGPIPPFLCRSYILANNSTDGLLTPITIYNKTIEGATIIYTYRDTKNFDYNGDGYIDIVSPAIQLKNNGGDTFENNESFGLGFSFSLDSDFNGDGFIDVIRSITYFSLVPLYTNLNDGTGNFVEIVGNNAGRFSSGTAGDFDNDGDIDVAAFDYNLLEVSILINGDTPTPVELSSFTSSVNAGTVTLSWTTVYETNNAGFDIERSEIKGQTSVGWKKIGYIGGSGNSNSYHIYSFGDKNLASGKYKYRLKQIDYNGNFNYYNLSGDVIIEAPAKFDLLQNYPNPFNPNTVISYQLKYDGFVTLKVFDNSGREVRTLINEFLEAGYYTINFSGDNLATGIYFYKLEADNFSQTKKMFLIK